MVLLSSTSYLVFFLRYMTSNLRPCLPSLLTYPLSWLIFSYVAFGAQVGAMYTDVDRCITNDWLLWLLSWQSELVKVKRKQVKTDVELQSDRSVHRIQTTLLDFPR